MKYYNNEEDTYTQRNFSNIEDKTLIQKKEQLRKIEKEEIEKYRNKKEVIY